MNKQELMRRYAVFTLALLVSACGVSLITRSVLGTSPISSIPYVLSLNSPLTMGTYMFLLNMVLILAQLLMLGKKRSIEKRVDIFLQIPVSVVFCFFIDAMMALFSAYQPHFYLLKAGSLILGCAILALGVALEVIADVTMLSGEYAVQIAAGRFKQDFGKCKITFDCTLVVLAAVASLLLAGRVDGVREGTIVAALIVGPFVKLLSRYVQPLSKWIVAPAVPATAAGTVADVMTEEEGHAPLVVTIAREYGSGGHALGQQLAERLGIPFYDEDLPEIIARESGMSADEIRAHEQSLYPNLLVRMLTQDYEAPIEKSASIDDALFVATAKVIRRLATEDCVIVGRCADWILRDRPGCINIFVHASMAYKVERATTQYGLPIVHADADIERINRFRAAHYEHYTGHRWKDISNYHLVLDTSLIPQGQCCAMIETLYRKP